MGEFIIIEVRRDKREYLPLLLIGDESEAMINKYIDNGALYVGFIDGIAIAVCVTAPHDTDCIEVKNLAVNPAYQRKGYGSAMLEHIHSLHPGKNFILGTGETNPTLCFYRSCGYVYSHRIRDYFTDNYPHQIIEDGVILKDLIYLKRQL